MAVPFKDSKKEPTSPHLLVCVMNELGEGGQALLHHLEGRIGVLVAAQVGDGPGDVPQEGGLDVGGHEGEEGLHRPVVDHKVSQHSSVSSNIAYTRKSTNI